jgi:hypothetical protein
MFTKLKLALALTATLAAGAAGFAAANTGAPADATGANVTQVDPAQRAQMRAEWKAKREARREKMLAKYDLNKDGKLEPNERKLMLEDRAEKRFDKLDVNHTGTITKQQFVDGFVKTGMRHRHHRGFRKGGRRGQGQVSPNSPAPSNGAVGPEQP